MYKAQENYIEQKAQAFVGKKFGNLKIIKVFKLSELSYKCEGKRSRDKRMVKVL
jgi:hypothetical protein